MMCMSGFFYTEIPNFFHLPAIMKKLFVLLLVLTALLPADAKKPATAVWYVLKEKKASQTIRPDLTLAHTIYTDFSAPLNRAPHPLMMMAVGNRLDQPIILDLSDSYIIRNGVRERISAVAGEEHLVIPPKEGKMLETRLDLVPYGTTDYGDLFWFTDQMGDWTDGKPSDFRFAALSDGLERDEVRNYTEDTAPFALETVLRYRLQNGAPDDLREIVTRFYAAHEIGSTMSLKPLSQEERKVAEKALPDLFKGDVQPLIMRFWAPRDKKKK